MDLKEKDSIRVEYRFYKQGTVRYPVYVFRCTSCKDHTFIAEKKRFVGHTGKCRFCVHKGVPYMSSYKHLRDGVHRTNRKRAKQKEFLLTFEEFLEFVKIDKCHYCNNDIHWVKHTGSGQHKYNLDRKDSSRGYVKDNLVVCCKKCNYMKGSEFSYQEFRRVVALLDDMRGGTFVKRP